MKLIFCIDDKKGMMFFGKRQSQDSVLREWIISHTTGSNLWMSNYYAKQFKDLTGYIADDDYQTKATVGDYCFVEDKGYNLEGVSEIILCSWNRRYRQIKCLILTSKPMVLKRLIVKTSRVHPMTKSLLKPTERDNENDEKVFGDTTIVGNAPFLCWL